MNTYSTYCRFIICFEPNNMLSSFISTVTFKSSNFPYHKGIIFTNFIDKKTKTKTNTKFMRLNIVSALSQWL